MSPGGKLFVHIFTHKWKPYHFKDDWMARTFFTGERRGDIIVVSFCQSIKHKNFIILTVLTASKAVTCEFITYYCFN